MMINLLATDASGQITQTIDQSKNTFRHVADTIFNWHSILVFVIVVVLALVIGRIIAMFLRRITYSIGRQIDKTENLATVNKLRRTETLIILGSATLRVVLVIFALYFWWTFTHPSRPQSTAILGATALFTLVLGGTATPVLRDFAYGAVMMTEHWYGVGDYVSIDPIPDSTGIVERVTLRSTKIRGVNGEVVWIHNQSISAVHVAPRAVSTIAIDLFVHDEKAGLKMIRDANLRLPVSSLAIVTQLAVTVQERLGDGQIWHLVAIGETAHGREWFLEDFAISILKDLSKEAKKPILAHDPVARYADEEAQRKFARTIKNARKQTVKRARIIKRRRNSK